MNIRVAETADLQMCLEMDTTFTTGHVWQLDGYEADGVVHATFREVRLPRPMTVSYPRDVDSVLDDWNRNECFLVVDDGEQILGYVDMVIQRWNLTGWINNVVVLAPYRRRGIGTALLRAAARWAGQNDLRRIMAETQTKNYPAISFYRKNAYKFCGFNDQYYANQDIALFFVMTL